jgi:Protein of unknown function (DUF3617)
MKIHASAVLAIGIWVTGAVPSFAQTGPDNLWEVTSSMAMEGMTMPGMTTQVCAKAGESDRLMPPMQGDCQITDRNTVGNRTTFRVTCTGKDAMSGTGEMTTGPSGYQGIMRLSAKMDGETTNVTTQYSGRLVGKCTAK